MKDYDDDERPDKNSDYKVAVNDTALSSAESQHIEGVLSSS